MRTLRLHETGYGKHRGSRMVGSIPVREMPDYPVLMPRDRPPWRFELTAGLNPRGTRTTGPLIDGDVKWKEPKKRSWSLP
jgi:hypothetical protein